jgi:hypothetical protein
MNNLVTNSVCFDNFVVEKDEATILIFVVEKGEATSLIFLIENYESL